MNKIHPTDPVTTVTAVPAGTLMLLANDGRVLMIRRSQSQSVLGGYWVFPGGSVDAAERDEFANPVAAGAVAACRELQEEVRLSIDPGALRHWAHWITPSARPRRFDTHFFVAAAPIGQEVRVDEVEANEFLWADPALWQSADDAGFPLTPPTRLVLREIAEALDACGSVDQLLIEASRRRVLPVLPKMLDRSTVVMPWDPGYAAIEGLGIPWDPGEVAARGHWPSRFPTR